jgi:hypothetical protein
MKTSSGLLLGVLFTLVVVIVAVVIYFNTRPEEEKTETPTGPSPTLPSIGDLTIAQTLSPNSNSETYTIEPYTIEYANGVDDDDEYVEGDTEKKLSKNVTFTLKWGNQSGFETVSKIQVEHYIRGAPGASYSSSSALQTVDVPDSMKNDDGSWNYADITITVSGLPDDNTNQYSFVGQNMFKVVATNANEQITLYDGTADLVGNATHPPELVIKPEDLTASIGMTESRTVTFDVSLLSNTRGTSKAIENTSYKFTATTLPDDNELTRDISITGIEFISQDTTGEKFKFKKKNTEKYLGVNKNASTGALTLKTDATKGEAAIITFTESITKNDDYRMLKTVVVEKNDNNEDVDVEYYLFGPHNANDTTIKWLTLFGRTSSQKERAMKDWKITKE